MEGATRGSAWPRQWLRHLSKLLPRSDLPGANQPTPFNLNRYVLLVFYIVCGCTTGAIYFGWPAMASLIFHNEGFSTLCSRDPVTGEFSPDLRQQGEIFICDAQDAAVQRLFTLAGSLCCVMSACGGALMDFVGPKWAMCLGQSLSLAGWLLLAFSQASPATYTAALALIGLGTDSGFLPVMCVTRLFPGSAGLIITILSSASSASSAVPAVLAPFVETQGASLRTVALCYVGVGPILSILVALFLVPTHNYLVDCDVPDAATQHAKRGGRAVDTFSEKATRRRDLEAGGADLCLSGDTRRQSSCKSAASLSVVTSLAIGDKSVSDDARALGGPATGKRAACGADTGAYAEIQSEVATPPAGPEGAEGDELACVATDDSETATEGTWSVEGELRSEVPATAALKDKVREKFSDAEYVAAIGAEEEAELCVCGALRAAAPSPKLQDDRGDTSGLRPFLKQVFSERYLLVVVYFIGVAWGGTFYTQAPRRMFPDSVVDFMEIIQPLSFIPCVILGKLADCFGIVKIMAVVNTCGLLMYLTSMIRVHDAFGYVSVTFYALYMSLFASQAFVYIEATFSAQFFGKLIGLTVMCGGLLSLLTNCMYEGVVIRIGKGDPFFMQIAMTILMAIQYIWLGILLWLHQKNPHPYRQFVRRSSVDHTSEGEASVCMVSSNDACRKPSDKSFGSTVFMTSTT
ncbi:putative amino acid transporter [Besnoitia besnoiti]|uniref:Putative amino acid transporter n=1 Tax=Besnoitia besnoiti TaxID=94643 RepID=A0A2A9M474_BESBE|nr:putative amino acid transporter [Besnoitia besnoiti]PFH32024.1 putative amino acid transporter [Besnoitia besnoiti]